MEELEVMRSFAQFHRGVYVVEDGRKGTVVSTEAPCKWVKSVGKIADEIADAIEQAIAERYMELPLDADGKPWHIGDHTESGDSVRAIGNKTIVYDFEENDCDWAHTRTHEKPDTIEDVLRDFYDMLRFGSDLPDEPDPLEIAEYVERIERMVK